MQTSAAASGNQAGCKFGKSGIDRSGCDRRSLLYGRNVEVSARTLRKRPTAARIYATFAYRACGDEPRPSETGLFPVFLVALMDYANASVATGCAVALAVFSLLQYVAHMHRLGRIRGELIESREGQQALGRELDKVASELVDAKRERTATRFETQALREFVSQEDGGQAIRTLLKRFVPHLNGGFVAFGRFEEELLIVSHSQGLLHIPETPVTLEREFLDRLLRGEPISLDRLEASQSNFWKSLMPGDRGKVQRLYLFGVVAAKELLGVLLTTELVPPGLDSTHQIELLQRLLTDIACCLRDKRQLESQQSQIRSTGEMLALRTVIDRTYDSPAQMLEEFLRQAAEKSAADRVSLYLQTSDAALPLKAFVRCGEVLQPGLREKWQKHEDELAFVAAVLRDPRQFSADDLGHLRIETLIGAALVVPVWQQDRLLGLVCFSRRARKKFSEAQYSLAAWTGALLADLIPRAVNQVVVERQARLDGLTQLANRGEFDRQIQQQFQTAGRSKMPLALLMFDLDRFKSINDTYGHRGGDAVLRATAGVIRECVQGIRSSDRDVGVRPFVARYGGEELAVLLQIDLKGARRIGELIRSRLESQAVEFEGHGIRVTTSAGLAALPDHADCVEDLITAADTALYQAKANGRNRLEVAESVLVGN